MRLILLRHGHDLPRSDGQAMLSQQGRAQVAATIRQLPAHGISGIDLALCSDTLRARESLEVAAEHITITRAIAVPALHPGGAPKDLLALVSRYTPSYPEAALLVIGHEPQLSNALLCAAGATIPEDEGPRAILTRGAAVIAYPRPNTEGWSIDPDELAFLCQSSPSPFAAAPRPRPVAT